MAGNKNMQLIGGIVVVIVVIAVGAYVLTSSSSQPSSSVSTTVSQSQSTTVPTQSYSNQQPIMLTDPAQVPNGAQALVITYTSVQAHTTGGSASGWVNAKGSGSVNLLALNNTSQVIAIANISSGSSINMVRFTITSAYITINGTNYNVSVPSGQVTALVAANGAVNASTSTLVQLNPAIIAVYSSNNVAFSLSPSATAVVEANSNTNLQVGSHASLTASEQSSLSAAAPSVQIVVAQVMYSSISNMATISVTIRNNGDQAVELQHVLLFGNTTIIAQPRGVAGVGVSGLGLGTQANVTIKNGAAIGFSTNTNTTLASLVNVGIAVEHYGVVPFQISSSGSMQTVGSSTALGTGYTLPPTTTETITFSGPLSLGNGYLNVMPVNGDTYRVVVQGTNGTVVSTTAVGTVVG